MKVQYQIISVTPEITYRIAETLESMKGLLEEKNAHN